jgi:hypothetical protein
MSSYGKGLEYEVGNKLTTANSVTIAIVPAKQSAYGVSLDAHDEMLISHVMKEGGFTIA